MEKSHPIIHKNQDSKKRRKALAAAVAPLSAPRYGPEAKAARKAAEEAARKEREVKLAKEAEERREAERKAAAAARAKTAESAAAKREAAAKIQAEKLKEARAQAAALRREHGLCGAGGNGGVGRGSASGGGGGGGGGSAASVVPSSRGGSSRRSMDRRDGDEDRGAPRGGISLADFAFPQLAATTAASAIAAGRGAREDREDPKNSLAPSSFPTLSATNDAATRRHADSTADVAPPTRPPPPPTPGPSSPGIELGAASGCTVSTPPPRTRVPRLFFPAAERVEEVAAMVGDGPVTDARRRCVAAMLRARAEAALEPLSRMGFPEWQCRVAVMTFGENVSAAAGWLAEGSAKREDPRVAAGIPLEGAPVDASETLAAIRELYSLGLARDDVDRAVDECEGDAHAAVAALFERGAGTPRDVTNAEARATANEEAPHEEAPLGALFDGSVRAAPPTTPSGGDSRRSRLASGYGIPSSESVSVSSASAFSSTSSLFGGGASSLFGASLFDGDARGTGIAAARATPSAAFDGTLFGTPAERCSGAWGASGGGASGVGAGAPGAAEHSAPLDALRAAARVADDDDGRTGGAWGR